MKTWKVIDEDCPACGGILAVFTAAIGDESCYDGDLDKSGGYAFIVVRCEECGFASGISVDEDGDSWVQEI